MLKNRYLAGGLSAASLSLLLLFLPLFVRAQQPWRPVTQAELDQKMPKVEPDADAEAIFWEVRLDNKKIDKLAYEHYVRVKIYTERGREKFSKFDIPFYKDKKVENVAARVIRPDGSIVELQQSDIFEREVVKAGKMTFMAKSFAVPNIAPGVIVEYQYRELFKDDSADNERLSFQRDIPAQRITYAVRPNERMGLNFESKNMDPIRFIKDSEGFLVGTRENVPAYREEPKMPPEEEVKQFVMLHYDAYGYGFNWSYFGNGMSRFFDEWTEDQKEITQKARELVAGAQTDDEKIQRIYDFAQKQIKNATFDKSFTDEQRKNIKNKKASDTLKRGVGSFYDIDLLFAALVRAVGFDANDMYSGNRAYKFFNHERDVSQNQIHHSGIAVRRGNDWKPYNPGIPFMPAGMTHWHDELISTMITGAGGFLWIRLPLVDYKQSLARRTGRFKLLEDGTLDGTVTIEYSGHPALTRRADLYEKTPVEREESVKKAWTGSLANSTVKDFVFNNFDDLTKPYSYSFHVTVTNYAQKTGKRIFLQPGFFEYGSPALFSAETRKYPIYFEHPWSESDNIEIELPKNFEADSVESPNEVKEGSGLAGDLVTVELAKETNTIKYRREFFFGANGKIIFSAAQYAPLKRLFDLIHNADVHSVSVKSKT